MAKRLPDAHDAIEGAGIAIGTADRLLSSADVLADIGNYGIARSLAVLALEESVKARTLGAIAAAAADGHRAGFSDGVLRKIVYSGHRERHAAGLVQHIAAAFPDVYGKLMLGMSVAAEELARVAEVQAVLAGADTQKQAGFYSDFDAASGSWSSPGNVTEAEFTKIRVLIGDYLGETRRQFDEFNPVREHPGPGSSGS
jgi:AbiV family abortive infection protein